MRKLKSNYDRLGRGFLSVLYQIRSPEKTSNQGLGRFHKKHTAVSRTKYLVTVVKSRRKTTLKFSFHDAMYQK